MLSTERLLRHRFQQFREALVGIIDSFFHPALERAIAVGDRLEHRLRSEPGSSSRQCFEGECFETHVSCFREPFKLKGVNNALGREHFMVHATKGELIAALILVDVAPPATAPGLKGLERHGEPSWSKSLDVELWIGEGLKHQLAWRVEFARDEQFLLPWFCRNGCFVGVCHWFFLSFLCITCFLARPERPSVFHVRGRYLVRKSALPTSALFAEPMLQIETVSLD